MKYNFIKLRKISWKLTFTYSIIFSLVLISLNAAILYGVKYFLIQQAKNQVDTSSRSTIQMIIGTPYEYTDIRDPELLNESQENPDIAINIADAQGKIVNSTENLRDTRIGIMEFLDSTRAIEANEKHYIVRNSSAIENGKTIAYLQIIRSTEKEYNFIKLLFIMMAIADFFGIIISVFAGYIVSHRTLRPIDRIAKTAQSISVSDLNSRIEVNASDDELARLAITFNDMIDRLKVSFDKQNQFVSDASHELRTPIAVIQGYINLIDRWGKEDKNVLQESIQAIKNETVNMTDLIERLLFLARSDSGRLRMQRENIVLNELVEEVIKESRLIASEKNISFKSSAVIELNADRRMIKQVLRALVDNSIKFTPANGEIEISTAVKNKMADIVVRDSGIGIPEEELGNIFNRFYRVDKARAKETGGSGLGLSIVQQIVDAHNGSIKVESTVGIGTKVTVLLPAE